MAKIEDPILFSKYFGIDDDVLAAAGLIDPFVDVDTQLFIDPVLLEKSSNPRISENGIDAFRQHFETSFDSSEFPRMKMMRHGKVLEDYWISESHQKTDWATEVAAVLEVLALKKFEKRS